MGEAFAMYSIEYSKYGVHFNLVILKSCYVPDTDINSLDPHN